jgi:TrmH family RNA methyltransferase
VGTVLRSANAFGIPLVAFLGDCADLYNPKAVRATMGAIFRQRVVQTDLTGLKDLLAQWNLPLYGAALSDTAADIRSVALQRSAVAVGNEGKGLSPELLGLCDGHIIIPMAPGSESLNAAAAASICIWETVRAK